MARATGFKTFRDGIRWWVLWNGTVVAEVSKRPKDVTRDRSKMFVLEMHGIYWREHGGVDVANHRGGSPVKFFTRLSEAVGVAKQIVSGEAEKQGWYDPTPPAPRKTMGVDASCLGKVIVMETAQGEFNGVGEAMFYYDGPTVAMQDGHPWLARLTRLATPEEEIEYWRKKAIYAEAELHKAEHGV